MKTKMNFNAYNREDAKLLYDVRFLIVRRCNDVLACDLQSCLTHIFYACVGGL